MKKRQRPQLAGQPFQETQENYLELWCAAGKCVRIRRGPLAGLVGNVRCASLCGKRLVALAGFGPGVFVAVSDDCLEPADGEGIGHITSIAPRPARVSVA